MFGVNDSEYAFGTVVQRPAQTGCGRFGGVAVTPVPAGEVKAQFQVWAFGQELRSAVTKEQARSGLCDRPFADAVPVVMLNQFGDPPVGAGVIADTARDEPCCLVVGVDRVHGLDIVELQRADRQP